MSHLMSHLMTFSRSTAAAPPFPPSVTHKCAGLRAAPGTLSHTT